MNVSSAGGAMAAQMAAASPQSAPAQEPPAAKAPPATDTVSLSPQAQAKMAAHKSCG